MSNDTDKTLELYKLEYEKGAERYENIYKAVWANFSYLTIVSGGIYAFGTKVFPLEVTAVLAVFPLLFWWVAIFEPMNRYGDQVEDRLSDVEKILNNAYEHELIGLFQTSPPTALPEGFTGYGLNHYTLFANRRRNLSLPASSSQGGGLFRRPRTRKWVRVIIPFLFGVAVLYAILSFVGVIPKSSSGGSAVINDGSPNPTGSRVAGVDMQVLKEAAEKNPKLKEDLDNLNKSLEAISNDIKQSLNGGTH